MASIEQFWDNSGADKADSLSDENTHGGFSFELRVQVGY